MTPRKTYESPTRRPTQREKTKRAFRAYADLLDTADWMRIELRGQLRAFGLNMAGFRVLEMLYSEGHMSVPVMAAKRQTYLQNMHQIIGQLEQNGWVCKEVFRLPPAAVKKGRLPKVKRGRKREGRRISTVRLTPLGENLIGTILPKHAKVVKALMRALDGREQESLSHICQKLRAGDIRRFVSELCHEEVDD